MAVALLSKFEGMKVEGTTVFKKVASVINTIRLDALLLAVFAQRALKFMREWCGMDCGGCHTMETPKKK